MTICTDENGSQILCPEEGGEFYGQDAQYAVRGSCIPNHGLKEVMKPEVLENDFVEVKDDNTGLTWLYIGTRGDYEDVQDGCDISYGGKEDWRFPTPKELMTLAQNDKLFNGNPATDMISLFKIIREGYESDDYSDKYGIYLWSSIENYIYALEYGQTIPPKAYENYMSVFNDGLLVCVSGEEYGKVSESDYSLVTRKGDRMVFDSSSNLFWQKDSAKAETWKDALNYCENLEYAGYSDWRLPNKNELVTLIDYSKIVPESGNSSSGGYYPGELSVYKSVKEEDLSVEPGIPSSFPGMKADVFWSSTSAGEYKWVVDMTDGTAYTFNGKTAGGFYIMRHSELPISVRCVRSQLNEKTEIPACNESGVAPCKDANGTIWSSVIYPKIFVDFDQSYISSQNLCRDRSCTEDTVDLRNVAEMCRGLNEKGSHKWRLPTIDEIRSILMSEKLNKDGSCGVTDKCFDVSCYSEESCLDDKPSQTLFYDFGGMISATPVKSDGDEDEDDDYDGKIWTVDMGYGALYPSDLYSEIPLYMLVQRCVLDKTLPYEKAPYTDPETGLTWSDISSGYLNLQEAQDYCYELSKGDSDHWWRVPTIEELKTLVRNCSEENAPCLIDVTGKYSLFGDIDYVWAADSDEELYYFYFLEAFGDDTSNTDWNRVRCVSDGSNPCSDDPCNGLARNNVVEKDGVRTCECGCPDFYEWNGSICASICSTDPCGSVLHSTGLCTPTSETTYECGCASGYLWNGSACVNPCEDDPCAEESANSTGTCTVVSAEEYKCSCNEDDGFFWEKEEKQCKNPCDENLCGELDYTMEDTCSPISAKEYTCDCEEDDEMENLYWMGMEIGCGNICNNSESLCADIENSVCYSENKENYECLCDEDNGYYMLTTETEAGTVKRCVNPCDANPCGEENGNYCYPMDATEYECECDAEGYYYLKETETETGTVQECVNPCDANLCGELEHTMAETCSPVDVDDYECDCADEGYYWAGTDMGCVEEGDDEGE